MFYIFESVDEAKANRFMVENFSTGLQKLSL